MPRLCCLDRGCQKRLVVKVSHRKREKILKKIDVTIDITSKLCYIALNR